ncbi:hypothetical protein GCM10023222_04640 [Saccharopolyspora cebuensis]
MVKADDLTGSGEQGVVLSVVFLGQAIAVLGGGDDHDQSAPGVEHNAGEQCVGPVREAAQPDHGSGPGVLPGEFAEFSGHGLGRSRRQAAMSGDGYAGHQFSPS